MNKVGGVGFLIFGLFVLLFVVVVLAVIFVKGKPEPLVDDSGNLSVNKTFFNITVGSDVLSKVSYSLGNESGVFFRGFLFPGSVEDYRGGVEANTSIVVSVWGDDYYLNRSSCNVTREGQECFVGVKRKASGVLVSLSDGGVTVISGVGVLQSPLLCFWWKSNLVNVISNLSEVDVP